MMHFLPLLTSFRYDQLTFSFTFPVGVVCLFVQCIIISLIIIFFDKIQMVEINKKLSLILLSKGT